MKGLIILFVFGIILSLAASAMAEVPQLINYQGRLTDDSGNPLSGSFNVLFSIYDADVDGNLLWQEVHSDLQGNPVIVQNGLFNLILGEASPIPDSAFDGTVRWLGIKIGADEEIAARTRLISVPYAYRAVNADSSEYSVTGGGWTDNGNLVKLDNGDDTVGIGTAYPLRKLDVAGDLGCEDIYSRDEEVFGIFAPRTSADPGSAIRIHTRDGSDQYLKRIELDGGRDNGKILLVNADVGIGTVEPQAKLHIGGTPGVDGIMFPDGSMQTTAIGSIGTILDYGTSTSTGTSISMTELKICYGAAQIGAGNYITITGLPFASAGSYAVILTRQETNYYTSQAVTVDKLSGSAFEIHDFTYDRLVNWVAIGH